MSLILSGSDGLSDIDGSASTPAIRGTDANTGIFFGADIIGFAEGGAECARFNADAQFVAAAGTALLPVITTTGDVNTGIFFPAADTIAFAEGGAEAMRIDSSGNLLVGITTASGKVRFQQTADATTLTLTSAQAGFLSSNQAVLQITTTAGSSNPTASFAIRSFYNGSGVFDARNDGTLYAQNTTVQSISDVRTKENIRDAEDGLDVITALRPVRFDFKEGFNNNRKNQLGFIAQEIEQVFPDAVDVSPQEDENGDPYKSVGPGALIPVLVKAIQELKAELDTVKAQNAAFEARLAALEAK